MKSLFIANGTVIPQTGLELAGCNVLIQDGKIAALGKAVRPPRGAVVIDAKGYLVTPGLIDAHTHLGNCGEGTGPSGFDFNEASEAVTPHARAIDGINPRDAGFGDARRGGVTTACVLPGSANVVCGTGVVLKTAGYIVDEMVVRADCGMKIAFGENPKMVHGEKRCPQTRMGAAALLRETLVKAREYARKRKLPPSSRPDVDIRYEPLTKVLSGEIPLRAHAHRADDIATAARVAAEFDCKLVSDHCTEGHFIADFLARRKIPCIVGPSIIARFKVELRERSYATAGFLERAGCLVALTTDHPFMPIDALNLGAATAAREGMSPDGAFAAITYNAALILGLNHRLGKLAKGYDADVVVWNDHPLMSSARVIVTIINGEVVYRSG